MWEQSRKDWLVGVYHGITEPAAVRRLRALPNSSVRLFLGGRTVSLKGIASGPAFHAKVISFSELADDALSCLITSSANLTGAALGAHPSNYEGALALSGAIDPAVEGDFYRWWSTAWGRSIKASDDVVKAYARYRSEFLLRNPDAISGLDQPGLCGVGDASALWIDAGAMSGGSRNQVEFNRTLASFFGSPKRKRRILTITFGNNTWSDRPLSPKTTTFGVDIWRLSLPTPDQTGIEYAGKILFFRKRLTGRSMNFRLDVADSESRKHKRWRTQANDLGYLGRTSGNRMFGYY